MKNDTSKTIFPAYKVKTYGGIPVAFIGLTLKATQVLFQRWVLKMLNSVMKQIR